MELESASDIHSLTDTHKRLFQEKTIWDDRQLFSFFFLLAQMCIVKFALKGFLFSFRISIAMQFIKLNLKPQDRRLKSSGCYLYQSHNGWHQTRSRDSTMENQHLFQDFVRMWMFLSLLFCCRQSPWQTCNCETFLNTFKMIFSFLSSIQTKGSLMTSDYWRCCLKQTWSQRTAD